MRSPEVCNESPFLVPGEHYGKCNWYAKPDSKPYMLNIAEFT